MFIYIEFLDLIIKYKCFEINIIVLYIEKFFIFNKKFFSVFLVEIDF